MAQVHGECSESPATGTSRGPSCPARPPADVVTVPANLQQAFVSVVSGASLAMSRTGRRPGAPETRQDILVAARRAFGERGYEATSLRSIADRVHVHPALRGTTSARKTGVPGRARGDRRAVRTVQRAEVLDVREAAELIVARYLMVLDHEETWDVASLVRSAVFSERAATMLREFLVGEMLDMSWHADRSAGPPASGFARCGAADRYRPASSRGEARRGGRRKQRRDRSLVAPVIEGYLR